ncbi:MAG: cysteine--tRNA ligase [Christensenellaceae bacterium]|jgi:cysteinyl-tRNA synthetase|nr:cysteine--tRNA ligase [Christensenellaceae bacterium]
MLKLYNTLTRRKQEFIPINASEVLMYTCGPTVYNYAHIGNLRTYVFMDLLRRSLHYEGYTIKGVMNITDVGHLMSDSDTGEDKMEMASREQRKSPLEIAAFYTDVFFADLKKLNINRPEIIAKATDHIKEMIAYTKSLLDSGYAYETSDAIYFDISKFPRYGMLSGIDLDSQLAGARVSINDEKRHPADFALWKKAEPGHIMRWMSPWGEGYPGWHIECSVMSQKYLHAPFDIHSGGVDHIPIHHENEIAQNDAITGIQTVNYWIHGEFMLVDGGKMSKSLGNVYTLSQLQDKGYSPLDFRLFCLNTHYRSKLNFTFQGMDSAKASREKLLIQLLRHRESSVKTPSNIIESYANSFRQAIEDDLNVPLALGILFTAIKEAKSCDIYNLVLDFDKIFALSLDELPKVNDTSDETLIPDSVVELVNARVEAKLQKNYALADEMRKKILDMGYIVIDTPTGPKITLVDKNNNAK